MRGIVVAVASDAGHHFGKPVREAITFVRGLGVAGDAHYGRTIKHRSRLKRTPGAPNLRQVHLVHAELFDALARAGFKVGAGQLGENVTTRGIALPDMPRGTKMRLGATVLLELTGLRNPCWQIDRHIGRGAMAAVLDRAEDGSLIRRAGVMAAVLEGGEVRAGDPIELTLPEVRVALKPV